ncbi:hypothetical protein [Sphingomonas sp. VDB2]|uniref:hypothetical protein n=1 Tax=Sphingomonas sp. VDB2 TaxID=3228751 RepID=UPI003A806EA7
MKKAEAEKAIRHLTHKWARENAVVVGADHMPSFGDFRDWLGREGYSDYLNFRSTMGAREDAEQWFDEELKQTWRN